MTADLFADLDLTLDDDPDFVAAVRSTAKAYAKAEARQKLTVKTAAIARKQTRTERRRAKCQATLAEVLPSTLEPDTSYHIISAGDVDALSYTQLLARQHPFLDQVLLSTWCLAMPDLDWLAAQQQAGAIGHLRFYCGEILKNTYPDVYQRLCQMEIDGHAQFTISRNHANVTLITAGDRRYTIESSANLNTNPRIEQTAIHTDPGLHAFCDDFFTGLRCIDKKARLQEQACVK